MNITYFITNCVATGILSTMLFINLIDSSGRKDMSHIVGVGIFWINLNRTDLCCWRLTLMSLYSKTLTRAMFII